MITDLIPFIELFFALMFCHFVADYALQNDFVAQAKNHTTALGKQFWHWVLPAHGMIHAGLVYGVTGSLVLGLFEFVAHSIIDWLKCDGRISFNTDQWLHVVCKVIWIILIALNMPFVLE